MNEHISGVISCSLSATRIDSEGWVLIPGVENLCSSWWMFNCMQRAVLSLEFRVRVHELEEAEPLVSLVELII